MSHTDLRTQKNVSYSFVADRQTDSWQKKDYKRLTNILIVSDRGCSFCSGPIRSHSTKIDSEKILAVHSFEFLEEVTADMNKRGDAKVKR